MARVSEKQLEDWIVEHPDKLQEGIEIVGRQICLPHGRLDLLGWNNAVQVIELKVYPLKARDIAQVLRYIYDVKATIRQATENLEHLDELSPKQQAWAMAIKNLRNKTHGMIVVTDASHDLVAAADAADIMVKQWWIGEDDRIHISSDGLSFLQRLTPAIQSLVFAEEYRQYSWVNLILSRMCRWSDLFTYSLERPWISGEPKGSANGFIPTRS